MMPMPSTSSEHVVGRDLITPDEIMRLPTEVMILLAQGQTAALARKIRYLCGSGVPGSV